MKNSFNVLLKLVIIIFVAEFIAMQILAWIGIADTNIEALADSLILIILLSPALYFIVYKPAVESFEIMIDKQEEVQKYKDRFYQSEKMATLGTIGTGIAHELNNPLTVIYGSAFYLQKKGALGQLDNKALKEIGDNLFEMASRMKKIIEHIQNFAYNRKGTDDVSVNLNDVIDESLILVEKQLANRNIEIIKRYDEEIEPILVNRARLEAVFQNLIINSRDAINSKEHGDGNSIILTTLQKNGEIIFSITDSGIGIENDKIEKIKEGFYTTKTPDKGTGLGYSLIKGVISDLKGTVNITSELNVGTTVELKIPITEYK